MDARLTHWFLGANTHAPTRPSTPPSPTHARLTVLTPPQLAHLKVLDKHAKSLNDIYMMHRNKVVIRSAVATTTKMLNDIKHGRPVDYQTIEKLDATLKPYMGLLKMRKLF